MTTANWYFSRNPKFTDSFERDLANHDDLHIGRDEPSVFLSLLEAIGQGFNAAVRSVRLRASHAVKAR